MNQQGYWNTSASPIPFSESELPFRRDSGEHRCESR